MCEVYILHDLVNPVILKKLDIIVGEGINVDFGVVVKGPLIFNVRIGSNLCDRRVNLYVAWGGKYSVVHIYIEDDFASIEHAVIYAGLS